MDFRTFKSISACGCSSIGSNSTTCSSGGVCSCKTKYGGMKCTDCKAGYFGFPTCQGKPLQKLNS